MIGSHTVLALIPARGGSRGIPGKNIYPVAGRPLLAWTIDEARKSRYIDRLVLSSDSPEIGAIARVWGCEVPFLRPPELAADDTPGISPALHALKELPGYEYVVLLQPTSPLRVAEDIDGCIETCVSTGAPSAVSVSEVREHPCLMILVGDGERIQPMLSDGPRYRRRQEYPSIYRINGAVYVARTDWLRQSGDFVGNETVAYRMPGARSLDIDTEEDLRYLIWLKENSNARART